MKRDLTQLSDSDFDLCVIGGGIYGACAAWDATLRGLSVALVEKCDFGHATSFNSQNTIHGGFRYLQNLDIPRIRAAVKERRTWMAIAPHLVHPMPFLIPTYRHIGKPKELFYLAFKLYDLLSFDRNRLPDPQKRIRTGRLVSRHECFKLLPWMENEELTGGAIFYDGLIHNSERLGFSFLRSAAKAGAVVANYAEAFGFLQEGHRIKGVKIRDAFTKDEFVLRAKTVVNMTGPWVNRVLVGLKERRPARDALLKVMYLAVKRPVPQCAVGLLGDYGRYFFAIPWHDHTLVGSAEFPFEAHDLDKLTFREQDVEAFIADVNRARPAIGLCREDVVTIRGGLLPADEASIARNDPKLTTTARIIDHCKDIGIDGLISVAGIKFTMARSVAQQVIDLVFSKLGYRPPQCRSHTTSVHGGEIERFSEFMSQALAQHSHDIGEQSVRHLVLNYGSAYPEVLKYLNHTPEMGERLSDRSPVLKAEVLHSVREEMAEKLVDLVFRRTELGILENPGEPALSSCAAIMAQEMGWDEVRTQQELQEVQALFLEGGLGVLPNGRLCLSPNA